MSFVGGGSDLPSYYERFSGAVVSTAITKYVYININAKFDQNIRVSYSKTEDVKAPNEVKHELVRACLNLVGIDGGIEIACMADIPKGTGLGSSSSFTTALLHGLYAYRGQYASAARLAQEACRIELDICNSPIGKQDQYAAAFGGFNFIEFCRDGCVNVSPVICKQETIQEIEESILMLYTGRTRSANELLAKQSERSASNAATQEMLHKMVGLAHDLYRELQNNNHAVFGEILHENWLLKRKLTEGVSDAMIDEWYEQARRAGALGGKILGAGAGGFLMLFAPKKRHEAILHALPGLRNVPVGFDKFGSRISFYNP
jgi:D-glycero-alpha-D-manno-heptose-7-phosphate kinase